MRHGTARFGRSGYKIRIAVRAGCVAELFEKADVDAFVSSESMVRVPFDVLVNENMSMWRTGGSDRLGKEILLQKVCKTHIEFKMFELALNYETSMTRYEFQAAWTQGEETMEEKRRKAKEYLAEWIQLIMYEKARQCRISDRSLWPSGKEWIAYEWSDMPMVIWIIVRTPGRQAGCYVDG